MFDDSRQILDSFEMLLNMFEDISLCATFTEATDVVAKVKSSKANVVIMDIDMPARDGITAVTELRKTLPDISIIMFTVFEDDDKIFNSICAGANGYLLKKTDPSKIVDAIREVVHGGSPMSPGIARRVLGMFQQLSPAQESKDYNLTQREKDVLKLLVKGLSYKMIAAQTDISFETVRTHIKNIYTKLHVASMTEAVAKTIKEKIV